jgi:Dyp-type peroxidase family
VPHILLVVAADDEADLSAEVERLKATIANANAGSTRGLDVMGPPQTGATLPRDLRGHEHFGFKDGISQPAIRGLASDNPQDFIDERRLAPTDPNFDVFAEPGRVLVWPGQFLLGYKRQDGLELTKPRDAVALKVPWQRNGSYLVYRRLQQKVHLFWRFCIDQARRLSQSGRDDMSPEEFAALLVGRWPSGAPLLRTPHRDDPDLAADKNANNDFFWSSPTPVVTLADGTVAGATLPPAQIDESGLICPFPAHIRKVNPRDDPSDTSGPRRTKTRLVLRRGIPYGPPPSTPQSVEDDGQDRGLLFMSYQTSIVEQFEFVTKTWINRDNSPHDSTPTTGQDPLIGQSVHQRFVRCALDDQPIHLPSEPWVVTTGGGYFFTPAISALSGALAE